MAATRANYYPAGLKCQLFGGKFSSILREVGSEAEHRETPRGWEIGSPTKQHNSLPVRKKIYIYIYFLDVTEGKNHKESCKTREAKERMRELKSKLKERNYKLKVSLHKYKNL